MVAVPSAPMACTFRMPCVLMQRQRSVGVTAHSSSGAVTVTGREEWQVVEWSGIVTSASTAVVSTASPVMKRENWLGANGAGWMVSSATSGLPMVKLTPVASASGRTVAITTVPAPTRTSTAAGSKTTPTALMAICAVELSSGEVSPSLSVTVSVARYSPGSSNCAARTASSPSTTKAGSVGWERFWSVQEYQQMEAPASSWSLESCPSRTADSPAQMVWSWAATAAGATPGSGGGSSQGSSSTVTNITPRLFS